MHKTVEIITENEQRLRAYYACPAEKSVTRFDRLLVVMVHGFPGHKHYHDDLYPHLATSLLDKGFHSLMFDFRGCGESDGHHQDFTFDIANEDFQNILSWAKDLNYEHFIFIGEGLGATFCAMNHEESVIGSVFLWPMVDLPLIAENVFHASKVADEFKKAGYTLTETDRISTDFIESLEKTDITGYLENASGPTLVMHGARDEVSPISQLDLIRNHSKSGRIDITSFHDGIHGLTALNHRKVMFYHITKFIERYSGAL